MLDAIIRALRLLSLPMIATSFVGAVALIYIGAEKMLVAAWNYFRGNTPPDVIEVAQLSDVFIVRALESLDAFLIAFAFLAFAYGMLVVFFLKEDPPPHLVPRSLVPRSVADLKESLIHVILVVLTVYFVRVLWLEQKELDFTLWAIPGSILLIAIAARISGVALKDKGGRNQFTARRDSRSPNQ